MCVSTKFILNDTIMPESNIDWNVMMKKRGGMPTTYTHYCFGRRCINYLPEEAKTAVLAYRDTYDIAVHGPDVFFYYKPFRPNPVNRCGSELHRKPARGFFENCARVLSANTDKREILLSYIFGFLSHFVLDSTCHSYVERKRAASQISHNRIETEYDAHLMRRSGIAYPSKWDRTSLLHPTQEIADALALLYPFDAHIMYKVICSQISSMRNFYSPNGIRRAIYTKIIQLLHIPGHFDDLFIHDDELPACRDSNLRLDKLMSLAEKRYQRLAENLWAYLQGDGELDPYFEHDFEEWPDFMSIPVFSAEEEKNYEVKE